MPNIRFKKFIEYLEGRERFLGDLLIGMIAGIFAYICINEPKIGINIFFVVFGLTLFLRILIWVLKRFK